MDAQTILILAVAGCILLIGAFVTAGLLIRRTVSVTIAGFSWIRQIFLENYVWVKENSYRGFPDGSRNQSQHRESYQSYEVVRTETITTSTGDGQSTTTSQPVYEYVTRWRTKYTYEIEKWVDSRDFQAEGTDRAHVYWPRYTLDRSTNERVKSTTEAYFVLFQNAKGKRYKCKVAKENWDTFDEQATCTLKINLFGQVKRIIPATQKLVDMSIQTEIPVQKYKGFLS